MEKNFWKENRVLIFLVCIIAALICLIALAVFRADIFIRGIRIVISILTPFIYGFIIAYLLRPLSLKIESFLRKTLKLPQNPARLIAILISLFLLLFIIAWFLATILPQIVTSIASLVSSLPAAISSFETWLKGMDTNEQTHEIILYMNNAVNTLYERLENFLNTSLLPTMQTAVNQITSSFMNLINVIKDFGLGCIISVYFMSSWERFGMQGKLVVYSAFPSATADWIRDEIHFIDKMCSGFIIGKLADSAIIGLICMLFCTLFNMPYALLVSVIVGLTNVIPFFGPYLGAIPSVLLIMTQDFRQSIIFLIFIIILQQVDGNVIGPKILGDKLGISSFWILFSILFFGALWGLPGMLIGAPLFAVIYDLIKRAVFLGLKARNHNELKEQYLEKYGDE